MAIAHQSTGLVAGADSGNITGNLPGTHGLNSILLAWAVQHDNVASTLSASSGAYTLIASITNGAAMVFKLFAKRDNGAETAPTLTHPAGASVHLVISSYSGVDPALSLGIGAGAIIRDLQSSTGSSATGAAFNITTPALTGLVSGDMRLNLAAHDGTDTSGGGVGADFTPPAGFTERIDTGWDSAQSNLSELADFLSSASATTSTSANNEAFGLTRNWIGIQFALSSDTSGTLGAPATAFSLPLTGIRIPGYPTLAPPIGPTQGPDPSTFDVVTPLPATRFVNPLSLVMGPRIFPIPAPYVVPVAGVVFTDAGSGTITLSGSATESASAADTGSGTITLSGTKTESAVGTNSGSGTITLSGTKTESASYADSRSGTITLSGSFTQSYSHSGSGSGTIVLSGTGVEQYIPPGAVAAVDSDRTPVFIVTHHF